MKDKKDNIFNENQIEQEIDLQFFFNLLIRNKYLISKITLISFLISCIYALMQKRVWEGKFEIVLSENERSEIPSIISSNSNLLNIAGIDFKKPAGSLKTEVGILESSSVLMPVFDYVRNQKGKNVKYEESFDNWKRDNLKIKLRKSTSILDIQYRDIDKELIIPVLKKMSDTYQIYSGRNKKRNLSLAKNYLENQTLIYKKESSESLRKLQEYALDKDLLFTDSIKFNESGLKNIGIGYSRVNAANQIKTIDLKIKKINELSNNYGQLRYIGLNIPGIIESGIPNKLEELDSKLLVARSKYTENDIFVKKLKSEKKELIKSLKEKYLGFLNAEKIYLEGVLESVTRPKEVLLKYKMLLRDANGDEQTLIKLENELRLLSLEEAKAEDPWELISSPNLGKFPVAPNRRLIALGGILIGILLGIIYSFFKEKKSGLIFEEVDLLNITDAKMLAIFNTKDNKFKDYSNKIFKEEILRVSTYDSINIVNRVGISDTNLREKLNVLFREKNVIIKDNFDSNKENEIIILITKIGNISFSEVLALMNRVNILKKEIFGIILIN